MAFLRAFSVGDFVDTLISLSAAFILGTLIGAERQYRRRGGGLRTHSIASWPASTKYRGAESCLSGPRRDRYCLDSRYDAALRRMKRRAMYGRRPRCKRNLTFCEAFGCSHVSGL
jgi:hypothetical protein